MKHRREPFVFACPRGQFACNDGPPSGASRVWCDGQHFPTVRDPCPGKRLVRTGSCSGLLLRESGLANGRRCKRQLVVRERLVGPVRVALAELADRLLGRALCVDRRSCAGLPRGRHTRLAHVLNLATV